MGAFWRSMDRGFGRCIGGAGVSFRLIIAMMSWLEGGTYGTNELEPWGAPQLMAGAETRMGN